MPLPEPRSKFKAVPSTLVAQALYEAEHYATHAIRLVKDLGDTNEAAMAKGRAAYSDMLRALGEPVPADITNR